MSGISQTPDYSSAYGDLSYSQRTSTARVDPWCRGARLKVASLVGLKRTSSPYLVRVLQSEGHQPFHGSVSVAFAILLCSRSMASNMAALDPLVCVVDFHHAR
jgi:hypothetical protein